MSMTSLASRGSLWSRLFATNVAAASANFVSGGLVARAYANPFAAGTNLALINVRESQPPGAMTPNAMQFRFFGDNAQNLTFSARIWGIEEGVGTVSTTAMHSWEPTLLAQLLVTLGNVNGVASTLIEAASFEADTISLTYGASQDAVISSNAADLKQAWAAIDIHAFPLIAVELDDGASATACNGLYRSLW